MGLAVAELPAGLAHVREVKGLWPHRPKEAPGQARRECTYFSEAQKSWIRVQASVRASSDVA